MAEHLLKQRKTGVVPATPTPLRLSPPLESDPLAVQRRALHAHVFRPAGAQRLAAQPVLRAGELDAQETARVEEPRRALRQQVVEAAMPEGAVTAALQRQAGRSLPVTAPARPTTPADWVTVMRAQAEGVEGRGLTPRENADFTSLQRQVTGQLTQGYRADRGPDRADTYAGHLVSLQRHPISAPVSRAVLGMLPPGERLVLQRAVDGALRREREEQARDEAALHLHALQRQLADLDAEATQPVFQRIQARRGAGNPLPEAVQRHLEGGLNHDLSRVRVHDDAEADLLARSVNATAFTTGSDVFFRSGQYNPNTQSGLELLAHEVTHTVQQAEGRAGPGVDPDAGLEVEARATGQRLSRMSGRTARRFAAPPRATAAHGPVVQRAAADTREELAADGERMYKKGVVQDAAGANMRRSPAQGAAVLRNLERNEWVFVQVKLPGNWYRVTTQRGEVGFVASHLVKTDNIVAPGARLHQVAREETALAIAQRYFGGQAQWGHDQRDFVVVLASLNARSLVGTFDEKDWKAAKFKAGLDIWVPSAEYVKAMRGKFPGSSFSARSVEAARLDVLDTINPLAVAGVTAGMVEGFARAGWDTIKGAWDLVYSVFTGQILSQAAAIWEGLKHLKLENLTGYLKEEALRQAGDFLNAATQKSAFARGRAKGWIVGAILFEVAAAYFSAGVATAVKGLSLARRIPALGKAIELLAVAKRKGGAVAQAVKKTLGDLIPADVLKRLSPRAQRAAQEAMDSPGGRDALREAGEGTEKARQLPLAIAAAVGIIETNDVLNTPVPAVLAQLMTLKARFGWIKRFDADPTGTGTYDFQLIASSVPIYRSYTPGTKGNWNKELNKAKYEANRTIDIGGYLYHTDAEGRVGRVEGRLRLQTSDRNAYQQSKVGGMGERAADGTKLDDGGHLIASIFNGAGERTNMVPMNANFNRGEWKRLENLWAREMASGKTVDVDIEVNYGSVTKNVRPVDFTINYIIDGNAFQLTLKNAAAGVP